MFKSLFNVLLPHRSTADKTGKVICAEEKCIFCGKCQKLCPVKAIAVNNRSWVYYNYRCINCGRCVMKCSAKALAFAKKGAVETK